MSATSRLWLRTTLALAGLVVCASPVFGQSQGRVVRDGAIIWRLDVGIAIATASAGTILDITARSDRWYEVIVPDSLGGRGQRGLIALNQVELLPGAPEPPFREIRVSGPAAAQRVEPAPGTRALRMYFSMNGGYQITANDFGANVTIRENAEDGRLVTDYVISGGPAFDVSGGGDVWRRLGVGVGVSRFSRSIPATLNASIPHPFFFNRARSISGDVRSLKREELAVHVQIRATLPVGTRLQAMAFGGPSFFQVKQGTITGYRYDESYPYDAASFRSATITDADVSKVGFNLGGDIAFFFTNQVGVGATMQFSGTTVELPGPVGSTQEAKVGGGQAGAGLRLRF
jgi:hypothetical protein